MKPPPFRYAAPESLEACLALLAEAGEEARILAGGQSLLPLLNLRMLRPEVVVDIGRIAPLGRIAVADGCLTVGALVRQRALESDPLVAQHLPLLREAAALIGHPATRSRGTVVGSLCHADPAAELPLLAVLLQARIHLASAGGERALPADAFFQDALTTAIAPEELATAVAFPLPGPGAGTAFAEIARRHGDFALVSAAALLWLAPDGSLAAGRLALGGVAPTPLGVELDPGLRPGKGAFAEAAAAIAGRLEPQQDLHASADYRRAMAAVLAERVLETAAERAIPGSEAA